MMIPVWPLFIWIFKNISRNPRTSLWCLCYPTLLSWFQKTVATFVEYQQESWVFKYGVNDWREHGRGINIQAFAGRILTPRTIFGCHMGRKTFPDVGFIALTVGKYIREDEAANADGRCWLTNRHHVAAFPAAAAAEISDEVATRIDLHANT